MKKTLIILSSALLLIAGLAYTLLFTQLGNNLLRPSIEEQINNYSNLPLKLETFSLSTNKLKVAIQVDEKNSVVIEGVYSLFSQDFDMNYVIKLSDLSRLNTLLKRQLSGQLLSDGNVKGNLELFKIKGKSDLALSKTQYAIVLKEMELDKAAVKLSNVDIKTLLSMLGEKAYSSGKVDVHVQLNDLDPTAMQGSVVVNIKEARLNAMTLQKELGLKISRTSLKGGLKATLEGTDIDYLAKIDSALATIYTKGKIKRDQHTLDANYKVSIKELSLLKSITKAPLHGPFFTEGTLQGKDTRLDISGSSNLADSSTSYNIDLIDLKPSQLNIQVKNASLQKLLYFVGEPSYASGKVDLQSKLSSVTPLNGDISVSLTKGTANVTEIKKAFDITLPYTKFDFISDAKIKEDKLVAKTTLRSNLATLKMKKTNYDIKDSTLTSEYDVFIPSLQKLEPVLNKKFHGEVRANGEIIKNDKLTISAHSNIFDGKINANIIDEKVNATFKDLHAIKVLQMLGYPQVMDAPVNGTLVYNTKTRQGKLDSRFDKARLTRSQMTDLISGLTRNDLTKERFNEGSLISIINKDIIKSDLKMRSKRVSLNSKKFIINSKRQLINANFALQIKKYKADILVTDNINSPKVSLDAKSMITPEIEEKVGKEINRFLKKLF